MRKPASQGSKLAGKGTCPNASDRRLQVQLTQEARIAPCFPSHPGNFAFAGFVSALKRCIATPHCPKPVVPWSVPGRPFLKRYIGISPKHNRRAHTSTAQNAGSPAGKRRTGKTAFVHCAIARRMKAAQVRFSDRKPGKAPLPQGADENA